MLPRVQQQVSEGRARLYALADELKLPWLRSSTNFVAMDLGSAERAGGLLQDLAQLGVFIRKPMVAPLDGFLRIGVGTAAEHSVFADAFRSLLQDR
jgi:histidinol-phosphate aminotransferase